MARSRTSAKVRPRWTATGADAEDSRIERVAPVCFCHSVKTTGRKMGLSDPAMAAWHGPKGSKGRMRTAYGDSETEPLLDEPEQAMPFGPIGYLRPPEVRVVDDPVEKETMASVLDFRENRIGRMALMVCLAETMRAAPNPTERER